MNARLLNPGADTGKPMPQVSIDSRGIKPGEAFFAIIGEKLDGHRFIAEVMKSLPGAIVLSDPSCLDSGESSLLASDRVWHKNLFDGNLSVPFLHVPDTTKALQDLAREIRKSWGGHLIGITGSMGKTTTRHYTASLLAEICPVHSTRGNFNNHIGLPLSILDLEERHQISVLELGMNHAGEIEKLSGICLPDTGVITNVAPVHLEFFSSVKDIAEAKAEILEHISPEGTLVYNIDDPLVSGISARFPGRKISFGFAPEAEVRISSLEARDIRTTSFQLSVSAWGSAVEVELRAAGKTGALNLAAAAAAGLDHGLTPEILKSTAPRLTSPEKRGDIFESGGITVWDDSYNSNPAALEALLDFLSGLKGFRRVIVVLGDMLELGTGSRKFHESCGRKVARLAPAALFTVGEEARAIGTAAGEDGMSAEKIFSFTSSSSASESLKEFVSDGDLVVVKGSRGMKMETIVSKLKEVE